MRNSVFLLGISVDRVTLSEAAAVVIELVERNRKLNRAGYIATVNIDYFVHMYHPFSGSVRSPQLLDVVRGADMVTADGMPLLWLSRLTGKRLHYRVTGASLVPMVAAACAKKGYSLFLLGGDSTITPLTAEHLQKQYPGLKVAGVAMPWISDSATQTTPNEGDILILDQIHMANPDILLIGLGCPKQEHWFARVQSRLHVPVSIGVGGTFKFLSGTLSRAPLWMQEWGMEWLYRWWQEPRLLTVRYLRDLLTLPLLVVRQIFQMQKKEGA